MYEIDAMLVKFQYWGDYPVAHFRLTIRSQRCPSPKLSKQAVTSYNISNKNVEVVSLPKYVS